MKVLVVGLGSIARKHIDAIRKIEPAAGVYALRSSRAARPVEGVTDIFEKKEIPSDIDFIIVSNPTSCHAPTIEALMDLGKPLFIEKPVFDSTGHDNLVREVSRSGLLTYVACNLRFLDGLVFLKQYLADHPDRRVNEVNAYCGSYLPDWRPGTDYRAGYSANPDLGGGVHLDLIHEIDYVRWLFGAPERTRGICRSASSIGVRAIDYANYVLVYPGFVASVILNYYRRDYRRTLEIVFDDGTWTLDLKTNTVTDSAAGIVYRGTNDIPSTYTAQMRYFVDLVSTGRPSANDLRAAYDTLRLSLLDVRQGLEWKD